MERTGPPLKMESEYAVKARITIAKMSCNALKPMIQRGMATAPPFSPYILGTDLIQCLNEVEGRF